MGYPVTNTSSPLFSRDTYICRVDLGLNMRCFVCNNHCVTVYLTREVLKKCQVCGWESSPVRIPEAIK